MQDFLGAAHTAVSTTQWPRRLGCHCGDRVKQDGFCLLFLCYGIVLHSAVRSHLKSLEVSNCSKLPRRFSCSDDDTSHRASCVSSDTRLCSRPAAPNLTAVRCSSSVECTKRMLCARSGCCAHEAAIRCECGDHTSLFSRMPSLSCIKRRESTCFCADIRSTREVAISHLSSSLWTSKSEATSCIAKAPAKSL